MEVLFLIGRVLAGGYFLVMGINHFAKTEMMTGYAQGRGVFSPKGAVIISGLALFLGGLGLLLGLYVQWSVALLVLFLLLSSFMVHHFWNDTDPMVRSGEMTNFLKNAALLGLLLMILAVPSPWPLAL